MIAGEAVSSLRRSRPDLASRLSHADRIIAFRNILVHGYHAIRDDFVWDIVQFHLPVLGADAAALLAELGAAE